MPYPPFVRRYPTVIERRRYGITTLESYELYAELDRPWLFRIKPMLPTAFTIRVVWRREFEIGRHSYRTPFELACDTSREETQLPRG